MKICISTAILVAFLFVAPVWAGDIHDMVSENDASGLVESLDGGADANQLDMMQGMPLHMAARSGWIEGITILLKAGADPFADDGSGTAVAVAAASDQVSVLEALLAEGIDVNAADGKGVTPLHAASASGAVGAAAFLLQHDADIQARLSIRGEMPIHLAARGGHVELVDILLLHGADPASLDTNYAQTPLHFAVRSGDLETVKRFVEAGSPLNATNVVGATALDLALKESKDDIARYLRGSGAIQSKY